MPQTTAGTYTRWLERIRSAPTFQECQTPPERWMQHLWRHQRLRREALRTDDGRAVRVLHPGFWNRSAGPDFKGAILQFEDGPAVSGDVEIDVDAGGWFGHRHAGNPNYRQVILHVVWQGGAVAAGIPILTLSSWLDSPLEELVPWLLGEAPGLIPANVRGGCSAPLRRLNDEALRTLLEDAARHRLGRKGSEYGARARHSGWDQALWEGLLAGLGYRNNTWPLRRIAELAPLPEGSELGSVECAQARLLGLGGFLPLDPGTGMPGYVRGLWDHWWRDRARFGTVVIPGDAWRLAGLRPANHPQRRLALAAHWLLQPDLPNRLVQAILASGADHPMDAVAEVLLPSRDPFWEQHWTLAGRTGGVSPLLGSARITDLAINVILPWIWARAQVAQGTDVREQIERRYFEWPAGEDNAVLRMARLRLMGGERRKLPRRAAIQQGLLQVSDDFCSATNALCQGCRFPELVDSWSCGSGSDGSD
jgi:Protein of unknown function (DUF2851)